MGVACVAFGVAFLLWAATRAGRSSSRNCQLCGNLLHRKYYVWREGKKSVKVCNHCNQKLERRKSSAAFAKPRRKKSDDDISRAFDEIF
jgi:ribosome-binding protein aMBF1 (putative translation factor)